MVKAPVKESPQHFFVKIPNRAGDAEIEAICDKMFLTRNAKITEDVFSVDDFCESPHMTASLKSEIKTPSIYTLYLFNDDVDDDVVDDDDEDEHEIYQISKLLAVLTFSKTETDVITIVTLCVNQDTRFSNGKATRKGYGTKIVNCLFNAVQSYVSETNKQINIKLTPVESSIEFYKKMGMRMGTTGMLGDRVMFKTFEPELLTLDYTNGIDPQFVDDFNELSERRNIKNLANFAMIQQINIIKEICRKNRHLKLLIDFIAYFPSKYHKLVEYLKTQKTPKMSSTVAKGVSTKRSTRKKGYRRRK
jgi:hypothetical protein